MFQKILIANRGEIAVRIIRACREMGIKTVAVYSEADRDALHTLLADEAICIGPAPSTESYLDMERILTACVVMKADAIHPGFGFLSENARFAELCEKCNIRFIGPSAEIINKMGNKSEARKTMMAAGVPVVPGSKEPVYTVEEGLKTAKEVGFPVMIKASSGGGGKGMRIEAKAPEDVHQVGQRQRPATALHHLVNRRVDADDPVRDGVFRMKSKMNEFGFGHGRHTPFVDGIFSWR